MNLFLKDKINPLVGAAGVSAVPDSARVVQMVGQQEDSENHLLTARCPQRGRRWAPQLPPEFCGLFLFSRKRDQRE